MSEWTNEFGVSLSVNDTTPATERRAVKPTPQAVEWANRVFGECLLEANGNIQAAFSAAEFILATQPAPRPQSTKKVHQEPRPVPHTSISLSNDIHNPDAQATLSRALRSMRNLSRAAKRELAEILDSPDNTTALIEFVDKYRVEVAKLLTVTQLTSLLEGMREVVEKVPDLVLSETVGLPTSQQERIADILATPVEQPQVTRPAPGAPAATHYPILEEAARGLASRRVVDRATYDSMEAAARAKAFTVANVQAEETLAKVRDSLAENVREGVDHATWRAKVLESVEPGTFLSDAHQETVFRTNVQTAFSDGQMQALSHPLISSGFPYSTYDAIHDDRVRPNHLALEAHGIQGTNVYRNDDPVFQTFRPPWDYNDRCGWTPITIRQAAERGVSEAKEWLETGVEPSPRAHVEPPPFSPPEGFQRALAAAPLSVQLSLQSAKVFAVEDDLGNLHDDRGRFTNKPDNLVDKVNVYVRDDPSRYGKKVYDLTAPGGAPVRGTPISPHNDIIPEKLYHMTTNLPAVKKSGMLKAAGEGGLGGDKKDQVVSMTISKPVADSLVKETKRVARLLKEFLPVPEWRTDERAKWGTRLVERLKSWSDEDGVDWKPWPNDNQYGFVYRDYGLRDWVQQYYSFREGQASKIAGGFDKLKDDPDKWSHLKDPQFWDLETMKHLEETNIGLVEIPKSAIDTGAMVTDFDLDNPFGLREVRIYGDVLLSTNIVFSTDAQGHEHRGKGPGGGQFVGKGEKLSRVETILRDASAIQVTDEKFESTVAVDQEDYDDIEARMTPEEHTELSDFIQRTEDNYVDEAVDSHLENNDYDANERDLARELQIDRDDIEEVVEDLFNTHNFDHPVSVPRGMYGYDAVKRVIDSLPEGAPQEIREGLQEIADDAEKRLEKAVNEYQEGRIDYLRDQYRNEFNDNMFEEVRQSYLGNFWRDNEDRFKSKDEGSPLDQWYVNEYGDRQLKFETSSGRAYYVNAYHREQSDRDVPEIQFSDSSGSFNVTDAGEAFQVFSKVVPAVVAYVQKRGVEAITFSAAEESRRKLYDRLVKTVTSAIPEYFGARADVGYRRLYLVAKDSLREELFAKMKRASSVEPTVISGVTASLEESDLDWEEVTPEVDDSWFTREGWEDVNGLEETDKSLSTDDRSRKHLTPFAKSRQSNTLDFSKSIRERLISEIMVLMFGESASVVAEQLFLGDSTPDEVSLAVGDPVVKRRYGKQPGPNWVQGGTSSKGSQVWLWRPSGPSQQEATKPREVAKPKEVSKPRGVPATRPPVTPEKRPQAPKAEPRVAVGEVWKPVEVPTLPPGAKGGAVAKAKSVSAYNSVMAKLTSGHDLTLEDRLSISTKLTNMPAALLRSLHSQLGGSAKVANSKELVSEVKKIVSSSSPTQSVATKVDEPLKRSRRDDASPPGPPPRPGLVWNPKSHRWTRPKEEGSDRRSRTGEAPGRPGVTGDRVGEEVVGPKPTEASGPRGDKTVPDSPGLGKDEKRQPTDTSEERVVATKDEVMSKIDRYSSLFRKRGNHQLAEWIDKLKSHIETVGTDEAFKQIATDLKYAKDSESPSKVTYQRGFNPNDLSDLIKGYLNRSGIFITTQGKVDPTIPYISGIGTSQRYAPSEAREAAKFKKKGVEGSFVPSETTFGVDKLKEAKLLPGLESTEAINKIMGKETTHITPEVVKKLDKKYGEGKWIIKSYGDEAYAGHGIFFPQRASQIVQDAKNTLWQSGVELAKYGFKHLREGGKIVGIEHRSGDQYRFGTNKYESTIDGDAREWADKAAVASLDENGAHLPGRLLNDGTYVEGKYMVQPAFPVVGVSDAERAAGVTIKQGVEGRVHIITRNGKAELVPHSTWIKGEHLPVVFESEHSRKMAQAAVDAINALPESDRQGQVYAPDVVPTTDGFKVVETNPSSEGRLSGYLHDNPMIIDSYVSAILNRPPQHVKFIRDLLTKRVKSIAASLGLYWVS